MPTGIYVRTKIQNIKISKCLKKLYKEDKLKIWNKGLTNKTDERIRRNSENKIKNTDKRINKKLIIKRYLSGLTLHETARQSKCGAIIVCRVLKEKNITIRSLRGFKYMRKYNFKEFKKIQSKGGKIGGVKAVITNRKNKTSLFDSRIQSMGGLKSIELQRKNKPYWFLNIPFDSQGENEIGRDLHYQKIMKLKEGVNCHIQMKGGEIDFLIKKYKCFIEYHPHNRLEKYNYKKYYSQRRKLLDDNGYKSYNLIILP